MAKTTTRTGREPTRRTVASKATGPGAVGQSLRTGLQQAIDPLPSWRDVPARHAIVDFVSRVTDHRSPDFVPPTERIATFDDDGTLWCETPIYPQAAFLVDRLRALAPEHPDWTRTEPHRSLLVGDANGVAAVGVHGVAALVAATHSGMTTDAFAATAKEWLATATNPQFGRRYADCAYQPMLEVMAYLRKNAFRTFIVSGGGADFLRVFAEATYGIPPEQVLGSTGRVRLESRGGQLVLVRLPELDLLDDGPGKPVGIHRDIGRCPIMAFGNSDGDLAMLRWATSGDRPHFAALVHHTDAERETAYDRESRVGTLDEALTAAATHGWTVVDMARDWATIFPPL